MSRGTEVWSGLRRALLPKARTRPRPSAALPLVAFVVGLPLACVILERSGVLVFSRLSPFALLLVAPWVWWISVAAAAGLTRVRALVSLSSRFALLGLCILALTEPRAVRVDERLAIVYVVDHSASMTQDATDRAIEYVLKTSTDKPEHDHAGLVFFGRDAAVELPPAMTLPYEAINVDIDRDGSDIGQALSLASALLPPEQQGRIVLVSDGVSTRGDLSSAVDDLRSKQIPVDVLQIRYQFEQEVWLERLELPHFVKIGEPFEAAVVMSSLRPGSGRLRLLENGREIFGADVEFAGGKNRFTVPVHLRRAGYYEYEALIDVPEGQDSWARNNRAMTYLFLEGEGRVLLVTDPDGDPRDWQALETALLDAKRAVERVSAISLPRAAQALLPYDGILFVNVPRDALDEVQVQAVHDAVFEQGAGFLMVGGPDSFGPGGWHGSVVEDLLPVSMDIKQRKVLPKGALAIVLHTCEFAQGNTWAKRITKQAIKVLSADDEVGALVYDTMGGVKWLFKLTSAANYAKLAKLINNAQIGDMPDFATTMQMALAGLQASDASAKHMIIISDGDPQPPPPPLLGQFVQSKISVSTVTVFPHGGMGSKGMQGIAGATGGRHYQPSSAAQLPSIFIKEAKTLRRSMIQEQTFTPTQAAPSQILKGVTAVPPLHGYVLTTPKPRSTTVLEGPDEEELDPVLSVWRYGLGTTAAFTSDLSPNWGADWVGWDGYRAFVQQLATEILRPRTRSDLRVRSYAAGGHGVVVVEDHSAEETLIDVQAVVRGPSENTEAVAMKQVAPRRYQGRFPLQGLGRYQVRSIGVDQRGEQVAHGGFVVPYSSEYLRFRYDPIALKRIAEGTRGRELIGNETGEDLFGERAAKQSSRSIVDILLLVLACLIPLDVAFRRVQIDRELIASWFRRDRGSQETLSVLLERKRAVRAGEPRADAPRPVAPREDAKPAPPTGKPPPVTESKPAASGPKTTTSRLLAAKRRAQRGGDQDQGADE